MGAEKRLTSPHPNPLPQWGRGDKQGPPSAINKSNHNTPVNNITPKIAKTGAAGAVARLPAGKGFLSHSHAKKEIKELPGK
jgi:hypothetical protein